MHRCVLQGAVSPRRQTPSTAPALGSHPPGDPKLWEESGPVQPPLHAPARLSLGTGTVGSGPSFQKEFPSQQVGASRQVGRRPGAAT